MTDQKRKENRKNLLIFCGISLFLAGCLVVMQLKPWHNLVGHGTSGKENTAASQSDDIETSHTSNTENTLYSTYGPLYNIDISLKIGNETEHISIDKIKDWVTVHKNGDDFTYNVHNEKISEYTKYLAERYSNFQSFFTFTAVDGTEQSVQNQSTGWIFDDSYAAEQLKKYILENRSVSLTLTDRSKESNKWWHRVASQYDAGDKKGDCYAEVSISHQYMWVHQKGKIVLESPVVTGCPYTGHDTPQGAFIIYTKQEHATLYGPGYETEVDYWIAFADDIGFHDAYWQDSFGGDVYLTSGSHGCVNMPLDTVSKLYKIAYVNMPVYVYY